MGSNPNYSEFDVNASVDNCNTYNGAEVLDLNTQMSCLHFNLLAKK